VIEASASELPWSSGIRTDIWTLTTFSNLFNIEDLCHAAGFQGCGPLWCDEQLSTKAKNSTSREREREREPGSKAPLPMEVMA